MDLPATFLGTSTTEALKTRNATPVLVVGKDALTRHDLAGVDCFNYVAAANLTRALSDLGAKSVRDVFENVSPMMLAVPHVGAVSLAVLGAAFQHLGIGGGSPLVAWVTKHRAPDSTREIVTFDTFKHRAADMVAATQERRAAKARRNARRDMAHRTRVDRLSRRTGVRV
jgi:hypothetical protein